jgi:hypothetical protein
MSPLPLLGQFQSGFASDDPWLHMLFVQWPISLAPALFTWLLPSLLRYARGGMAWIGAGIALVFTALLPLQQISSPWAEWYPRVHPWLFGIFYVYVLAGLALCIVGIYDGKRSAIWALLAVLSLTGGAAADTVIWFGWASSSTWVPSGFVGFWILLGIGYVRRQADPLPEPDVRESARVAANNRTRRSRSIPRKLLREGNLHLLPIYYVLNLSDLGREGIENSGSYRFADHIYCNQPSGRTALGRWLDARLMGSPATQAFRRRYLRAQEEMHKALASFPEEVRPLRILAVPCGLPRDLTELAKALHTENRGLLNRLEYHGMDVDPELLRLASEFTRDCPVPRIEYHHGNALLREDYPAVSFHAVVSTGLGEFLEGRELGYFYRNVYEVLASGGTFYTSATRKEKRSDAIMSAFELITQYRTTEDLATILREFPWSRLTLVQDNTGLQTFVVAVK